LSGSAFAASTRSSRRPPSCVRVAVRKESFVGQSKCTITIAVFD
jgi:hypothetical protein